MNTFLVRLVQRFRPRVGWGTALLGLAAALCIPLALGDSTLNLPASTFAWAALLGFGLGLRSTPPLPDSRSPQRRVLSMLLCLLLVLGGAVLLVLAAEDVLPSLSVVLQDAAAYASWLVQRLRGVDAPAPLSRAALSFAETLPRFWQRLLSAPDNGQAGARTMVAVGGVLLAWIGTFTLGHALLAGRALLAWQLPFLTALTLITVFSGGNVLPLIAGLTLLLLLLINGEARQREAAWERAGADYSSELRQDVLVGGGALIVLVLVLASALPAWLNNPLANALWGNLDTPSGIAELEKQMRVAGGEPATARVGLSKLPVLSLGQSLEQGPPDQQALRITLSAPLPDTPVPHYWRARLFTLYNGRDWTTDAVVTAQSPTSIVSDTIPGVVVQTIEDVRQHEILLALPDVFALDIETNAERLPDGTLAALTVAQPVARYRALSRPQELAVPPPFDTEPPNMSAYLTVPPSLTSRVQVLARQITADAGTQYQQALALETYLRKLPYSYQVTPLPARGDAVDFFLFNSGSGYCTYYASAMAVMARSLGIPARVATGYFTGEYDPATRTYTVYENDAHAWPELYLDGRWLPFEPTPIRPTPARESDDPPALTPVPVPDIAPAAQSLWWVWLLVLLGILGLSAALWQRGRRAPLPLVMYVQQQIERLGQRAGVAWPPGATLHEYSALLAPRLDGAAGALDALVTLVEQARYGGRALDAAEETNLRQELARVHEQLEKSHS